ncbi:MAG: PilZ domain-containing protein [Syntrophales bacterium]|jgi:hypothetical protein|nr:PilZ domain-containing protein [Syntrophales bacterium]MCU0554672.1 PilZ domain-containing protein [Syntrophales bacterium]MCU0584021.1 PilZ domain-containing protein [Syntrophales bacterium]
MNFKTEFPCQPNRREYSRVAAVVPFGVRLVPEEERKSLLSRISNQTAVDLGGLPEIQDQALAEWLSALNRKLDLILNALGAQKLGFSSLPVRQINISGGGLSFASSEAFNRGDILEIMTVLSAGASVALYIYGEVVASDRRSDGFEIGLKFVAMDDQIREEICRFVFERERQILREKRR